MKSNSIVQMPLPFYQDGTDYSDNTQYSATNTSDINDVSDASKNLHYTDIVDITKHKKYRKPSQYQLRQYEIREKLTVFFIRSLDNNECSHSHRSFLLRTLINRGPHSWGALIDSLSQNKESAEKNRRALKYMKDLPEDFLNLLSQRNITL